jgi:hypothetical protein
MDFTTKKMEIQLNVKLEKIIAVDYHPKIRKGIEASLQAGPFSKACH